jgi:hypothetical protein
MFIDDEANQSRVDLYGDEKENDNPIMDEYGNLIQEDLGRSGYDDDL